MRIVVIVSVMNIADRYPLPEIPELSEVSADEEFGFEVHDQFMKIQNFISGLVETKDTIPRRIVTIQNNLRGDQSYITHNAVLMLLDHKGLLDRYYEDPVTYRETDTGWEIRLDKPLAGTKFREQFRFESKDIDNLETTTTHSFTLWYQLLRTWE